jgi:putative molybdopterin biosynthesis protein
MMAGRRAATSALESQVRIRRLQAGQSQQDLAARAGLTRQAISAIEGGRYVPNTIVALRLARILGCRVEELFALPEDAIERDVEVVAVQGERNAQTRLGSTAGKASQLRAVVVQARGRWVAHPLHARQGLQEAFAGADALLCAAPEAARSAGSTSRSKERASTAPVRPVVHAARLLFDEERLAQTALLLGCDPSLGIVAAHMGRLSRRDEVGRLAWLEAGSQAALDSISRGTAHLAGSHLRDAGTGDFNVPQARRALAGTGGIVVAFSRWEQGLVVAPGNPKGLRQLADLARPDVRLVNRETGAGSRHLLDQLLAQAGIPSSAVSGYDRSVSNHFEVACAVATGGADTGVALAAAAEAYGLDFIPLAEVHFDLVIPGDHLGHPAVVALLEVLQSRALRDELRALPGYDVDALGTVRAEIAAAA